ncbi:BEL1-like homeodomain protein 1 [Acorus gramineus]|uniref:BEL1-like homeodomain protein 1 n=1 Tax=Acorus gramineus TaxID=55184 RepID=A0AAV9AID4_ACOGR|nr:BEL1-like homeodomain protein 1 [Acorus gramineus]
MATYFHNVGAPPELQPDSLQTLYLMNPNFLPCSSDATPPPAASAAAQNMFFFNPPPLPATPTNHHLLGLPIQDISAAVPRLHYWTPSAQQGLSLSLSPQPPTYTTTPHPPPPETNGASGGPGVLIGSKYLKAAQELLEEVVGVRGRAVEEDRGATKKDVKTNGDSAAGDGGASGADLCAAERHEVQLKKAKLVSMLDEVEQRHRRYRHQMQIITTAFEEAAGVGAAKTYASVALRTISRQFRCLRDAISGQIQAAGRRLGEEEFSGAAMEGGSSRLRFVDHHLRQQRALQRLGMIQHNGAGNAWRPQRGLPERSVSVLRAWLFEHFLHPYPKDSDKHMLAKQTGLTRSQVSNWFINARVRLWKPMVEEMYAEELKEQEDDNDNDNDSASKSSAPPPPPPSDEVETSEPFEPKKAAHMDYLQQPPPPQRDSTQLGMDGFMKFGQYFDGEQQQMRFSNNGVSLTLGLPHCEGGIHQSIPLGSTDFLGGGSTSVVAHAMQLQGNDGYEGLSIQTRKRFADFVA